MTIYWRITYLISLKKKKKTPTFKNKIKTHKTKFMTWLNNNGRHASVCKIQPFHTMYNMTTLNNNFTYYFIAIRFGDNTLIFVGMGSIRICIREKVACSQIFHNNHPLFTWSTNSLFWTNNSQNIVLVTLNWLVIWIEKHASKRKILYMLKIPLHISSKILGSLCFIKFWCK